MSDDVLFNAHAAPGIAKGTCVVIDPDGKIKFAGPIKLCPTGEFMRGCDMLLHPQDFELFKTHVMKERH